MCLGGGVEVVFAEAVFVGVIDVVVAEDYDSA